MRGLRWAVRRLPMPSPAILVDLLLLGIAALSLAAGLGLRYAAQPIPGGVITNGRVVDHVEHHDEESGTYRGSVVAYTDREDSQHRLEIAGTVKLGKVVAVRYDPRNPARAQRVGDPDRGLWTIFVALGVVTLLLTLCMWSRLWWRGR